jgi:phospholipid/cholesterol/gamma-HCH transport system ATP-binding protein
MIIFDDVWARYGTELVLRGVSFTADSLKITALVGPSGSGKSTCLRLIMGFIKAERGRILIDGQDVEQLNEREWVSVRSKMGMVFQNSALFDSMTVCQNVGFYPRFVERQPWRKVRRDVMLLLHELGLEDAADKLPGELSGGMQRRVALARSLIYKPKVLLYDEPTTGLDPQMTDVVNEMVREMSERYGVTSIVVSHDLPSINAVADHVVLIDRGESLTIGKPAELLRGEDPRLKAFAGGWREQVLAQAQAIAEIEQVAGKGEQALLRVNEEQPDERH